MSDEIPVKGYVFEFCQTLSKDTLMKIIKHILDKSDDFVGLESFLSIIYIDKKLQEDLVGQILNFLKEKGVAGFPIRDIERAILPSIVEFNSGLFSYYGITYDPSSGDVEYKGHIIRFG